MHCPRCGSSMDEEHYGVTLDHCRSCGGIWFDADELKEAIRQPSSARLVAVPGLTPTAVGENSLRCPRCHEAPLMTRHVHGGQAHGCERCHGVFVGSRTFLTILDRKGYGIRDGAMDTLSFFPEIAEAGVKGIVEVLEVFADVFSGW